MAAFKGSGISSDFYFTVGFYRMERNYYLYLYSLLYPDTAII